MFDLVLSRYSKEEARLLAPSRFVIGIVSKLVSLLLNQSIISSIQLEAIFAHQVKDVVVFMVNNGQGQEALPIFDPVCVSNAHLIPISPLGSLVPSPIEVFPQVNLYTIAIALYRK